VEKAITPRTKAIITVNLYGNMSDMVELSRIADRYGVHLVEDAAESLGSKLNGIRSGKFGIGSTFSFHRTKTLTTGEGGMLLLDDDKLYDRCMFLRDHGRSRTKAYFIDEVAFKYMPFNVQAALGYAQFLRIDELVDRKRRQFYLYRDSLGDLSHLLQFNYEPSNVLNSFWITAVVFDKSLGMGTDEIIGKLAAHGVPSRPFFYPLSSLPAYKEFNRYRDTNVVAYDISTRAINLPGAANLTEEQMLFVCDGIRKVVRGE
jgi:perosamine synthetase